MIPMATAGRSRVGVGGGGDASDRSLSRRRAVHMQVEGAVGVHGRLGEVHADAPLGGSLAGPVTIGIRITEPYDIILVAADGGATGAPRGRAAHVPPPLPPGQRRGIGGPS